MKAYKYHEYIDNWIRMVEQGEVNSCVEQKQLNELVKKELDRPDVWIDSAIIYEAVETAEKYFPFGLIPAQRFFYAFVFGVFLEDGSLLFDEYFAYMGRGSGKNGLLSTISFVLMSEKHGVMDYNIDIVATSEKQAKTSYEEVYNVIDENPKLSRLFNKTKVEIKYKKTRSILRYCTSNANTQDGGRPGAIMFDEVHEYSDYENINVHKGGLGKKRNPRIFYITTDGDVRESVLDDLKEKSKRILLGEDYHNGFFPWIFKMDNEKECDEPNLWDKAIPRINYDTTLKRVVMKQYLDSMYNADERASFLTKRMNTPKVNEAKAVAEWDEIKATNQAIDMPTGIDCMGAVDFADLKDFCSVGLLSKKNGKRQFLQHTFIHEKSLKSTKFNINIDEAVSLGLATIVKDCPIIPEKLVVDWFIEKAKEYNILKVVADRFRYSALKEAFQEAGITLTAIPSGYVTHNKLHPIIVQMFANRTLTFGDDKLMRWYCNNVFVKTDQKGNKSYHKIEPIKRKTDGFFCFLHALSADDEVVEASEFVSYDVVTC